ncbi:MAG: SpoIIE family protein phosphatase [Gammaproteobacteria bacterium]|nr:SpoIIE family protein phosphatase [Gammaproteobacteria bacterium]
MLLGKDFAHYGEVGYCHTAMKMHCAISVGADKTSPSLRFKGDLRSTNEDALTAVSCGDTALLAVADAHFGQWASQALVAGLAGYARDITDQASLYSYLQQLCDESCDHSQPSETTLLMVCLNLLSGDGFGVSFGDSSAVCVGRQGVRHLNTKNSQYVSLNKPHSLDPACAEEFSFTLRPDELLVVFTDGVDECHYGSPATSVTDQHLQRLYHVSAGDAKHYLTQLVELALAGVNGNPGGQDNIAIVTVSL